MTWDTLQARITNDERKIIAEFKKKHLIKSDGQLVRKAIEDLIGISIADATRKENLSLPKEYITTYYFYEYCKRAFKSFPKSQKKLEELFKKWARGYFSIQTRKYNSKLAKANKMWNSFKEHDAVGRKKSPKRHRGRPKDTGLDTPRLCGKGHNNWSSWTSTDGTIHKYCKTCRQVRAETYSERKTAAKGSHTDEEFQEKLKQYDTCPKCKRKWEDIPISKGSAKYKITKDHKIPLSKGGTDDISNIQPLCYQCNFKKGHS